MKRIGVVTGTRAEYGLLRPLMERIKADPELELCTIVTGAHLSPEFGLTYREIEEDGFAMDEKVEILLSSDTPDGICKSMALGMIGFSGVFARRDLDLLLLLGDRYEALAAAAAAMAHRLPIAHLHGGELTEGAMDDCIRHSITKMATLHFTSTEEYRRRVIQLGEEPDRVFWVGALGVENSKNVERMTQGQLEESLGFCLGERFAVVTYHPVTLEEGTAREQFENLLAALDRTGLRLLFTKANADAEGRAINALIDQYAEARADKTCAVASLGQKRYLSALSCCSLVVGNSSSGIIEAPSFGKPVVNIGDRQKGRVRSACVIDCGYSREEIQTAIAAALSDEFRETCRKARNPYEKPGTADAIMDILRGELRSGRIHLKKKFYDIDVRGVAG